MGENLYPYYLIWLKKRGDDAKEILLMNGVEGLLSSFECWLLEEGYTQYSHGAYSKPGKTK